MVSASVGKMQAVPGRNTYASLEGPEKASWRKQQLSWNLEEWTKWRGGRCQRRSVSRECRYHAPNTWGPALLEDRGWREQCQKEQPAGSRDGPHEPWTSSKGSERPLHGFSWGDMISLVVQRGWKSSYRGAILEAKEAEGRLHGSTQAGDNGVWRSTVAVGEVLGGREASKVESTRLHERASFFSTLSHRKDDSASSWESEHQWSSKSEMWREIEAGRTRVHFGQGEHIVYCSDQHTIGKEGRYCSCYWDNINWACGWKTRRGRSSLRTCWGGSYQEDIQVKISIRQQIIWAWVYMESMTKGFSTRKTVKGVVSFQLLYDV